MKQLMIAHIPGDGNAVLEPLTSYSTKKSKPLIVDKEY